MSISSTEVLQANKDVRLPVAKDAKEAKKNPSQVIVNVTYTAINGTTAIEVDQKIYNSPMDLVSMLTKKVALDPVMRVVIRADKDVKFEYMRQLLEAIGSSGVGNVTFSVVDKEGSPKPS
jgi:biopolymer transport protein ExbD